MQPLCLDDDDLSFEPLLASMGPCRIFSPIGHASPPLLSWAKRAEKTTSAAPVQFFEITVEKVRRA